MKPLKSYGLIDIEKLDRKIKIISEFKENSDNPISKQVYAHLVQELKEIKDSLFDVENLVSYSYKAGGSKNRSLSDGSNWKSFLLEDEYEGHLRFQDIIEGKPTEGEL